jgi:hypothetical protein
MNYSACRSCGADIVWAATEAGRRIPLNPKLVLGGNVDLHKGIARVRRPDPAREGYVVHFATCPAAAEHRRHP